MHPSVSNISAPLAGGLTEPGCFAQVNTNVWFSLLVELPKGHLYSTLRYYSDADSFGSLINDLPEEVQISGELGVLAKTSAVRRAETSDAARMRNHSGAYNIRRCRRPHSIFLAMKEFFARGHTIVSALLCHCLASPVY
ncbi:hypothetical protein SKAU_G00188870 [Synaphobranchus kaupii]|uniref:Uncharacterized protein n=1 Tax=Synaphobranchus kaupii TaxID=118154 RepID=A0A9Q1IX16_SYNKA|nr:hypothetical protein SKAU_G00188870 [Synaphobranchus kaupii]